MLHKNKIEKNMHKVKEKTMTEKELLTVLTREFKNQKASRIDAANMVGFLDALKTNLTKPFVLRIDNLVVYFEGYQLFDLDQTFAPEYNATSVIRDIINYFQIYPNPLSRKEVKKLVVFNK